MGLFSVQFGEYGGFSASRLYKKGEIHAKFARNVIFGLFLLPFFLGPDQIFQRRG